MEAIEPTYWHFLRMIISILFFKGVFTQCGCRAATKNGPWSVWDQRGTSSNNHYDPVSYSVAQMGVVAARQHELFTMT